MRIERTANCLARNRRYCGVFYKEWAKVVFYLVNKYGIDNQTDVSLCQRILDYDEELRKMLKDSMLNMELSEVNDIIAHYEVDINDTQKKNRALIKGELNV